MAQLSFASKPSNCGVLANLTLVDTSMLYIAINPSYYQTTVDIISNGNIDLVYDCKIFRVITNNHERI
jgi:hypothetical protein